MSRIYLSPPDVGEAERTALIEAFDSGWIAPAGPELAAFETDVAALVGWPGAVALASGSAALHLSLLASGVERGDRVFVSSFTFAASGYTVDYCGAEPVFIDSDTTSWNMNPELLADALVDARRKNALPKAVVVVDLYGQCADYDQIVPLCHEHGVAVIEDAAEALGATNAGRPAGSLGDISVFSFNGNKIITTSGGGMLLAPNPEVTDRARYLATQARQPAIHYEHTEIGYNYRLSNLLAALGRAQLRRLPAMIERRRAVSDRYREQLAGLPLSFMPIPDWSEWNAWLTCIVFESSHLRDAVMAALDADDIESRPLWKPLHLQPVFRQNQAYTDGTSQRLFELGLCLPSGSALTDDQIDRVAKVVCETLATSRPAGAAARPSGA